MRHLPGVPRRGRSRRWSREHSLGAALILFSFSAAALAWRGRFPDSAGGVRIARNPPPASPAVPVLGGEHGPRAIERWVVAVDESLEAAAAGLDGARAAFDRHRLPRGPIPASPQAARAARRRLLDLRSRPLEREEALEAEWLDALLCLRTERWLRAAELLRGLAAEPSLPPPANRDDVAALLEAAGRASSLGEIAACSAGRAVALAGEALRLDLLTSEETLAVRARLWAARAAAALAAGEPVSPPGREVLGALVEKRALAPSGGDGDIVLRALQVLGRWAEAALARAAAADDVDAALATLAALPAAPDHGVSLGLRDRRRLRAQLLETRGRERWLSSPATARDDLLAAAQLHLDFGHELPRAEADLMAYEAAGLLALAGAPRAALAALEAREVLGDDALLLQARLRLELGEHRAALAALEGLLGGRAASAAALGPIIEEARLLRGVTRLRLGAAEEVAGDPGGKAGELLRGAAEDLRYLLEHLDDSSPVSRAALYHRALQLEAEAGRSGGDLASGSRDAVERLEAAANLLVRWLAGDESEPTAATVLVLDRLASLEIRLQRPSSARERLERLSSIEPRALLRDASRFAALFERSEPLVAAILEEAPYRLADLLAGSGALRDALARYEAALTARPESLLGPWARLRRADILLALGEPEQAAAEAIRGLAALDVRGPPVPAGAPPHLIAKWRSSLRERLEAR